LSAKEVSRVVDIERGMGHKGCVHYFYTTLARNGFFEFLYLN